MADKQFTSIRDWVEPAHPMVLKFRDDLLSIYRLIRDKFQQPMDKTFDKVAQEIGYLVTTTLPLSIEVAKGGKIKNIELGADYLKGTIFERVLRRSSKRCPEWIRIRTSRRKREPIKFI